MDLVRLKCDQNLVLRFLYLTQHAAKWLYGSNFFKLN